MITTEIQYRATLNQLRQFEDALRTSRRDTLRASAPRVHSSRSTRSELKQMTSGPRSTNTTDCAAVTSRSCKAGHSPIWPRCS